MRVLVVTAQVPFLRGGAEVLALGLLAELRLRGHQAESVAIPFKWYPPERILDQILACRLLDLTESSGRPIDRILGLKFPAYLVPHPAKVLWIIHQHRSAYDLWQEPTSDLARYPNGRLIRDAIERADRRYLPEARAIFTISETVSARLAHHCGITSRPLYHPPPGAERFYDAKAEPYLFFPSRLGPNKRQALVLEALTRTTEPVRVAFAGTPDVPTFAERLKAHALALGVGPRVTWLGALSEEDKRDRYARSLGVIFPPVDEDYGYVTLEAMLSAKPVLTCTDSGGPLEFVRSGETGLIVEPTLDGLAAGMDHLWRSPTLAHDWGRQGRARYAALGISWDGVVRSLLS